MEEEPWDELCGPPPASSRRATASMGRIPTSMSDDEDRVILGVQRNLAAAAAATSSSSAPPVRRSKGSSAPPPVAAFNSSTASEKSWSRTDPPMHSSDSGSVASTVSSSSRRSSVPLPIEDEDMDDDNRSAELVTQSFSPPSRSVSLPGDNIDDTPVPDPWEGEEVRSLPDYYHDRDPYSIRQEALKMLEVADDQLAGSPYSVHRTVTGGFIATHKALSQQNKKRVPAALAGLKYTASRLKPYRDDPYAAMGEGTISPNNGAREAYEYGDDNVVDVIAMERRNKSYIGKSTDISDDEYGEDATPYDPSSKSNGNRWSSRYSLDRTVLAMAGGSTSASSRRFTLDKMDAEVERERQAARNLFINSETRNAGVFGSGYAFRSKHVFGKQGVTIKNPNADATNLRASLSVEEADDSDVPAGGLKSWQDQLLQKKRQRRIIFIVAGLLFVFALSLFLSLRKKSSAAAISANASAVSVVTGGAIPQGAITFYATSDVPYDDNDKEQFAKDLQSIPQDAAFLVHLGNIQEASTTLCAKSWYADVANILTQNSPVTTFVLPGTEDWPDCPDQDAAWNAWTSNFMRFSNRFPHSFDVNHQVDREENFAMMQSGVFFAGVHVVDGPLYSENELARRNKQNYDWIKGMISVTAKDAHAICIFGNAHPSSPDNQEFFGKMASFLQLNGVPAVYVHASATGGGLEVHQPFEGADLVTAIQVAQGGLNSPTRISVGTDGTQPFIVS